MEEYWKAAAIVILTVILGLAIEKKEKDISVILSMTACAVLAAAALKFCRPIIDFLWQLQDYISDMTEGIRILFKVVGITLVSEITGNICSDSGNGALGNVFKLVGSAVILYISLPMFQIFMEMIQDLLGEL